MAVTSTRENLIVTMQDLLWERGYTATSPRTILDRAGVGQGSMYHHFAGKEALALAALERNGQMLFDRAAAALRGEGTATERIKSYLLLERDALRGCPIGRMTSDAEVVSSSTLNTVLSNTFDRIRELIVEAIKDGVRQGEFKSDTNPIELADTVLAVVQGGYVLARAAADSTHFDRAVHGAATLFNYARKES